MNPAKAGTVYVLVDPRSNQVRYVGATTQPLQKRLKGHLASPTPRVKAWVDEMAAGGHEPQITAVSEGVPASDLRDRERAEITRRLVAGENLLNESATRPARDLIEQQRVASLRENERAAWEYVAQQVRESIGGPLPPGALAPVPLDVRSLQAYNAVLHALALPEDRGFPRAGDHELGKSSRLMLAREEASDVLWRSTRPLWGRLRSMADQSFEFLLSARVGSTLRDQWTGLSDASRYLALLPWATMAVSPWAALAERAGMDHTGSDFIEWVSGDESVREALTILMLRSEGRLGSLSALDNRDNFARPSTGLVAMTAAHRPGFVLPDILSTDITEFMRIVLLGGQLTSPMADLLLRLDPQALDRFLGPNIASGIDDRLRLPAGTSRDVLSAVLDSTSYKRRFGNLENVVARANGAFPTVESPDFATWSWATTPMFQAIVGSLVAAGVLSAPGGGSPDGYLHELRALWSADLSWLERSA